MSYSPTPYTPPAYPPPAYPPPAYPPPAYPPPAYPPPASGFGPPIPLVPLVPAEGALVEEEPNFVFEKSPSLSALLTLPIILVIALVVALGGGGGGGGGGGDGSRLINQKKKKKCKYEYPPEYPYDYPPAMGEEPYTFYERSGAVNGEGSHRSARDTKEASGLPALSIAQVERLTSIVFSALRNQECVQRLLCETGSFSRSFSTAKIVTKAVQGFVPESFRDSYDIFVKGDQCERFVCGDLPVRK